MDLGGERAADKELLAETLEILFGADRVNTDTFRRVGAHVFDRYFAGDEDLVASQSPKKAVSYRLLCERAKATNWDEGDLRRAVWGEIVSRGLDARVANAIKPTYLWMLYRIENRDVRRRLAERLAAKELRGRAAKDAIIAASMKEDGRAPRVTAVRTLTRIQKQIAAAMKLGAFSPENLAAMSPRARREARRRCREAARDLLSLADLFDDTRS